MGNRLPGLVTAFALALVTQRILLIKDKDNDFFRAFEPALDCKLTDSKRAGLCCLDALSGTPGSAGATSAREHTYAMRCGSDQCRCQHLEMP